MTPSKQLPLIASSTSSNDATELLANYGKVLQRANSAKRRAGAIRDVPGGQATEPVKPTITAGFALPAGGRHTLGIAAPLFAGSAPYGVAASGLGSSAETPAITQLYDGKH